VLPQVEHYPTLLKYQLPFQVIECIEIAALEPLAQQVRSKRLARGVSATWMDSEAMQFPWMATIFEHILTIKEDDKQSQRGIK
jgi:hypothetical protein